MLSISAAAALAYQCAPAVAPETLLSVAHAESELDTLAIGVNHGPRAARPANEADAARIAKALIAQGYSIDLGIAQINSRNLQWLGLSVEDAFDVCRNFAAAARVLQTNYAATSRSGPEDPLGRAISRYNTGNDRRGFANGYVGRVYRAANIVVPALRGGAATRPSPMASMSAVPDSPAPDRPIEAQPATEGWDVFARGRRSPVIVFGDPE
ncbi:lytic transglycosylase domain-containing protein [Sphingomonas sp. SRS2]|uniref:lytic transglycosylase domain-containing protein n=1 Tax=Sphingomonas sp. SRS2 TaxID=133190 RepID=UPI0006986C66|nr:lytic transglycosylase domain-containing protein [Sphingomonas sp. SRS2]